MRLATSQEDAQRLDNDRAQHPLRGMHESYEKLPPDSQGNQPTYLVNHSLGLPPANLRSLKDYLGRWKKDGVEGHFGQKEDGAWYQFDELFPPMLQKLFGAASESEVTLRGGDLSTNIALLIDLLYKPETFSPNYKILALADDFYSDGELVRSQIAREQHTRKRLGAAILPDDALMLVRPKEGSMLITDDDIYEAIKGARGQIALAHIPEVHFLTGYHFDTNNITRAVHGQGGKTFVDAAHALGNVQMRYRNYGPDAAAACTYKYGSAGPGNDAVIYLNQRHGDAKALAPHRGWFSYDADDRFSHGEDGEKRLAPGASSLRLGNTNMASAAILDHSLRLIANIAGIDEVASTGIRIAQFFREEFQGIDPSKVQIITPDTPGKFGAMVTLSVREDLVPTVKEHLEKSNIMVDWRKPNIMRVSFPPLHNGFEDAWKLADALHQVLD